MTEDHSSCIKVSEIGIVMIVIPIILLKTERQKQGNCNISVRIVKETFIDFYNYKAYGKNINLQIIRLTKEGLGIRNTARILQISTTTLLKRIT